MSRSSLALALLLASVARAADPLSPKELAVVDREMGKEMDEVEKKYGNKKPNELTLEERRGYTHDRAAAERKVLDKHGVDSKAYANRIAKLNRAEREEVKAAGDALEAKEKAEEKKKAEAAKDPAAGQQEVKIQRGFNEEAPVTLDETAAKPGEVVVEKGIPADAQADQDEASGGTAAGPAAPESAPANGEAAGKKK